LLARLLRSEGIDARHFSAAEIDAGLPPGANPDGVAIIFLLSAFPSAERERADSISRQLHELLPQANLIRVFCPGVAALSESSESDDPKATAGSLGEAVAIAESWKEARSQFAHDPQSVVPGAARSQTVSDPWAALR
jgi:hypothetical protein